MPWSVERSDTMVGNTSGSQHSTRWPALRGEEARVLHPFEGMFLVTYIFPVDSCPSNSATGCPPEIKQNCNYSEMRQQDIQMLRQEIPRSREKKGSCADGRMLIESSKAIKEGRMNVPEERSNTEVL